MLREMAGGDCEFLKEGSELTLHPVAFGARKTRGKNPSSILTYVKASLVTGQWENADICAGE
jgi:hydroxyethylthiazole kinase-like sugar kinase family protein